MKLDHLRDLFPNSALARTAARWGHRIDDYWTVEPGRTSYLARILLHQRFETVCLCAIISNAFFSAYVADYEIKNVGRGEPPQAMRTVELTFLTFYLLEVLAKLAVHGPYFFCNSEWRWNVFDLLLVLTSAHEQVMTAIMTGSGEAGNPSFMRVFRLLKLTKVARLFRVLKFFRELRLMLLALKASFSSLFWAVIMLACIFYVFGLVILQGLTMLLVEDQSAEMREKVLEHFDSLPGMLVALYKASTGGEDWGVYYSVINEAGWAYGLLFLSYIAFIAFSVMNILTGIIVENVVSMPKSDHETMLLDYRTRTKGEIGDMRALFRCLDSNRDGILCQAEWEVGISTERVMAKLAAMDLDIGDSSDIFEHLSHMAESGLVDMDTFVSGCLQMKGTATSLDVQLVAQQGRDIQKTLAEVTHQLGNLTAESVREAKRRQMTV